MEPTPEQVLHWEQRRREALLAGDAEALAPLLSGRNGLRR